MPKSAFGRLQAIEKVTGFLPSGILFNHESPLGQHGLLQEKSLLQQFASRKVMKNLCLVTYRSKEIGGGLQYVIAMWMMLQHSEPEDFVIATGKYNRLQDFLEMVFDNVGMDWRSHVVIDKTLYRPSELKRSLGNPSKAQKKLGWISRKQLPEIIQEMLAAEQEGIVV